jgi:hypothetical protein
MEITALGLALSKAVAKLTLGQVAGIGQISNELVEIVAAAADDPRQRKSLVRQLDLIGDRVATELEPYFEIEFDGLQRHERVGAQEALVRAVEAAQLTPEAVVQEDASASRVAALLDAAADSRHLGPGGRAFLKVLIRETSVYLAASVQAMPRFEALAAAEQLRREREVAEAVDAALREIPKAIIDAINDPDARDFELDYRRQVWSKFDQLTIFGVAVREERFRHYPLTVAYFTLRATWQQDERPLERSVEEVLSQHRRIVVRGEAGSGKTTLLQWLAVRAAQRSFTGSLAEWNTLIPLYVPLRAFARDEELPRAARFVDYGAGVLAGAEPPYWVHNLMRSGQALVLLDGLDELSGKLLKQVGPWVADLVRTYGESTFVVTSRPSALAQLSLIGEGFRECALQPMSEADILTFVDHWHRAALRQVVSDTEAVQLTESQKKLESALATSRDLRDLARSPLLAALVCALSRDRRGNVPRDRLSLYATALEVLVYRRDEDRGLRASPPVGYAEAVLLLQDAAYWMLRNEEATIERAEFVDRVARRLPGMSQIRADPETVAAYLLERTGLLREPTEGEIDFVHLTFRDFLAAKAIVQEDDVRALIQKARTSRTWEEVTVFTAGLATEVQRRRIFQGLLFDQEIRDQPDGTRAIELVPRQGQEFLALACREVSIEVPPAVDQQVRERVNALVPPRTARDARLLAAAGEAAVAALAKVTREVSATDAVHTVQALAATSLPSALPAMAEWMNDPRERVREVVAGSWSAFDPELYAEEVLAKFRLETAKPPRLTLNRAQLPFVSRLPWLREVTLLAPPEDLNVLRALPLADLAGLEIRSFGGAVLAGIEGASELRELKVVNVRDLRALGALDELELLERVVFSELDSWARPLRFRASSLDSVEIELAPLLEELDLESSSLRELVLSRCQRLRTIRVSDSSRLERFVLRGTPAGDVEWLAGCENLAEVELAGSDIPRLPAFARELPLEVLNLSYCRKLVDLEGVASMTRLTKLSLSGCWRIRDLRPLESLVELEELDLSFCTGVSDVSPLGSLPKLRHVDLTGGDIRLNLSPIAHVPEVDFPYPA